MLVPPQSSFPFQPMQASKQHLTYEFILSHRSSQGVDSRLGATRQPDVHGFIDDGYSLSSSGSASVNFKINLSGSIDNARANAMNSKMSNRLSSNSILFMKDGGLPNLRASSRWETP